MEWISTEEQLPQDPHKDFITFNINTHEYIAGAPFNRGIGPKSNKVGLSLLEWVDNGKQKPRYVYKSMSDDEFRSKVTHWMYLPEKPKPNIKITIEPMILESKISFEINGVERNDIRDSMIKKMKF
jgi:hypothetical protein